MQHDPGYGHFEERVRAFEKQFDRLSLLILNLNERVEKLEVALHVLTTIVERHEEEIKKGE